MYSLKRIKKLKDYYDYLGVDNISAAEPLGMMKCILKRDTKKMLISGFRPLRLLGKIFGIKRIELGLSDEYIDRHYALIETVELLIRKGVPVYFVNRVGKKKDHVYSESESRRMREGSDFIKMHENAERYEDDLKEIFGDRYSREYVREIGKIPQVIRKLNLYCHEDCHNKLINVENGRRVVNFGPETDEKGKVLHVYGRCGAFGYAVEDRDTLPSLIQKKLVEKGLSGTRVVNHGLWGADDSCLDYNFVYESENYKKNDVIFFYRKHLDKDIMRKLESVGMVYRDITKEWHEKKGADVAFFNQPGHMNGAGYRLVADIVADDLIGILEKDPSERETVNTGDTHRREYLDKYADREFETNIKDYIEKIKKEHPGVECSENNGAIVMNCNPFTRGHRWLIENAAGQVDRLFIFVVEEDRSLFRFEDRFEMIRRGVEDLTNVIVVPSGKFIISSYTFPEYFMKDYVKNKDFDVSMDVSAFGMYIAPALNIKVRFAGSEPLDPVTNKYNETMDRLLPEYGVRFKILPRKTTETNKIINATEVRRMLAEGDYESMKEYIPESTYSILMEKYSSS